MSATQVAELQGLLRSASVGDEEYCLVGGAVLGLYGIRRSHGLVVCLAPSAYDRLVMSGRFRPSRDGTLRLSDRVEALLSPYSSIGITDGDLFENESYTVIVDGFRSSRLELELLRRSSRRRDQDLRDIAAIEAYATRPDARWDWALLTRLMRAKQRSSASKPKPSLARRASRPLVRAIQDPARAAEVTRKLLEGFVIPGPALTTHTVWLTTRALLSLQYDADGFTRADVAALLLAAESSESDPEGGRRLYEQVQALRSGPSGGWSTFLSLSRSMKARGFDSRHPILVDSRGNVVDGAQRLAAALHVGAHFLPVRAAKFRFNARLHLNRFRAPSFAEADCSSVASRLEQLLCDEGTYFPVVLWPPASEWFDEIEGEVARRYKVVRREELSLEWPRFASFVRAAYETDDFATWMIEAKIQALRELSADLRTRLLWIELPRPNYRPEKGTRTPIPADVKRIKRDIRDAYSRRIDGYVFDVIVHVGDNPLDNAGITRAFKQAST